jgi:hypothetical protein
MGAAKQKKSPPDFGSFAASVRREMDFSVANHAPEYRPALDALSLTLTRWELRWRLSLLDALSKAQEISTIESSLMEMFPSRAEIGRRISEEISADPVEVSLLRKARRQVREGQVRWLDPASQDFE